MAPRNMFADRSDLHTEADVEALIADRLLAKLRYPDHAIKRKHSLQKLRIPRGSRTELYRPDYVLYDRREEPAVIFDVKAPSETPDDFRWQVAGYALCINERYEQDNPVRYVA